MDALVRPGHLLESLTAWMPDYIVTALPPQHNITRQPVFSARLGSSNRLKRTDSLDSIVTQLSLLSCSSYGYKSPPKTKSRRRRRRASTNPASESIWVKLASKRVGIWNKMFKHQVLVETETEIFQCLPEDEKLLVLNAGMMRRHKFKRSHSESPRVTTSSNQTRPNSAPPRVDCRRISKSERTQHNKSDTHFQMGDHNESIWHEDDQNLDFDHRQELSVKVKSELKATTSALRKVTGHGGDISFRPFLRPLQDYPRLVAEDYSRIAKFPHSMRISPHLSKVICADMAVRMGRPRYHEIRERDMAIWNKDHALGRAHRNLKVFNWLHSLKEFEFDLHIPETDKDSQKNAIFIDEIVESVD